MVVVVVVGLYSGCCAGGGGLGSVELQPFRLDLEFGWGVLGGVMNDGSADAVWLACMHAAEFC